MWSNVIGQERIVKILKNIYNSGRVSHAYIFYGKEGTGKDAAAIEFAKLLNCENKIKNEEACDTCRSCKQIKSLNSSLFQFVTALPSSVKRKQEGSDKNYSKESDSPVVNLKKEIRELYFDELSRKSEDFYYKIRIPDANNIRIDSIRYIKKLIYFTGEKGKKKIFLISGADDMNIQSANSFLKILEEPPGDALIILTTSRLNSLPQTITGRCQRIRFDNISISNLKKFILQRNGNIKPENAEIYASIADGSIQKCKEIMDSNFLEFRDKVIEYLSALVLGRNLAIGRIITYVVSDKDKGKVRQFLMMLLLWFRDTCISKYNIPGLIINKDKSERIENFAKKFPAETHKIIETIEDALRELDLNLNTELMLYNLTFSIKALIKN